MKEQTFKERIILETLLNMYKAAVANGVGLEVASEEATFAKLSGEEVDTQKLDTSILITENTIKRLERKIKEAGGKI